MDISGLLSTQGLTLTAFGGAYLILLANMLAAVALFSSSRAFLVITPNLTAKRYGLYVVVVLLSLIVATALDNALLPIESPALQYAAVPHLAMLLVMHLWIYYKQEPWLIGLGASALIGAGIVAAVTAAVSAEIHVAHWIAIGLLYGLVGKLWFHSVSTKRAFTRAASIYIATKEKQADPIVAQTPWLGLPQWLALIAASLTLAAVNSVLRGSVVAEIPAVQVLAESGVLLGVTALVCAIPAVTYWLAHKHWMPELTRFTWLVWLVVGFAFTYGNYLTGLRA
jgi:hypothetical protein